MKHHQNNIAETTEGDFTSRGERSSRLLESVSENGPIIQIKSPDGFDLVSPVDFDILIEPRSNFPADMETLKVEYKSGLGWLNVTRRIKKHATIGDNRIVARNTKLDKGRHTLRVSMRDRDGGMTRKIVTFTIR